MIRSLHRLLRDQRGIALIEFAFAVPVLMLMLWGTIETSRYVQFNQKVEGATNQVTNIINQNLNLSLSGANAIMQAISEMMAPFDASDASVYITAVQQNQPTGQKADVLWQIHRGPSRGSVVAPGGKGSKISPANIALVQRDQVIVVEVTAVYKPVIWSELFPENTRQSYKMALYRPRYGAFQFEPR